MRLFILILPFLFSTLHAQILDPQKVKFGKISSEELKMITYEKDQEAEAVVLFDKGNLRMDYDERTGGFQYLLERHLRIKILKQSAVHYQNFVFPLQKDKLHRDELDGLGGFSYTTISENGETTKLIKDEIEGLRGFTYNLVNGKEEAIKLKKENITIEKVSDFYSLHKVKFSNVKEGSIIELKYTLKSNFLFSLPTWYFQREIPVDYTFFEAVIPEYFIYNVDVKGFAKETLIEDVISEYGRDHVFIKVDASRKFTNGNAGDLNVGTKETRKFDFKTATSRWAAVEVPKLESETNSPPLLNYFFRVSFELASTFFPFRKFEDHTRTWEGIIVKYRSSKVQAFEKPNNKIVDLVQGWTAGLHDPQEKIKVVSEQLKKAVIWNGVFNRKVQHVPLDLIKLKKGNSSELNYLLLSLLRAAGIAAEPILISTRSNGKLQYENPSVVQFNHIIIRIVLSPGKHIFLDATSDNYALGILPKYDLNEKGRLIRGETSEWVDIENAASNDIAVNLKLAIKENNQLEGVMKVKETAYAASNLRSENDGLGAVGIYLEKWTQADVSALEISGFEDKKEDILINAQVDFSKQLKTEGGQIHFPSVLIKHFKENPFPKESRKLPIDFLIPHNYVYVSEITLPEGKHFEKIPESIDFALPDKKAIYSIRFIELNNGVQIIERFSIKKPFYSELDYPALRTFFDLVIEHQDKPLVVE